MTADMRIGIKGWQNYSSFALFSSSSQRADRPHNLFVNTYEGNLTMLATDIVLQGRVTPSVSRAYNSLDTNSNVPRAFGDGWFLNLDECLISGTQYITDITDGDKDAVHKDASGGEWDYTCTSGTYNTPRGLKSTLAWDSTNGWYTLTNGKLTFRFELADYDSGSGKYKMAVLTRIEDKYGNALIIERDDSSGHLTVQIVQVYIRFYDVSATSWDTHQVMSFRYVTGTNRIETITLSDTSDGGGTPKYIYLYYTYASGLLANVYMLEDTLANIASTPGGGTDLLATVGYTYNNELLEYVYNSIAMCVPSSSDS